jgi:DNA-binding response OmpR family regulator
VHVLSVATHAAYAWVQISMSPGRARVHTHAAQRGHAAIAHATHVVRDARPAPLAPLVLLASADATQRDCWDRALTESGFPVIKVDSLEVARWPADAPEVLVADLFGPRTQSAASIRRCRDAGFSGHLLALTESWNDDTRIAALDAGADACATRTCAPDEMVSRVRALSRRSRWRARHTTLRAGDLTIDLRSRSVDVRGVAVTLSPLEYTLLATLVRQRGRVVGRAELRSEMWRDRTPPTHRVLDATVKSLRAKIDRDASRPSYIITYRWIGYLLAP